MKKIATLKIIALMCFVVILPGCLIPDFYYLSLSKAYPSKQDNRCIELKKPVALWAGRKVDTYQKNFISGVSVNDSNDNGLMMTHKKVDVIDKGVKFRVDKVYERYSVATPGGWSLRVNLAFLEGKYQGKIAEISGMNWLHPKPWLFSYNSQDNTVLYRKDLNTDGLEFNPEIFKYCDNQ